MLIGSLASINSVYREAIIPANSVRLYLPVCMLTVLLLRIHF